MAAAATPAGALPDERLLVQRALAGDHQPGAGQRVGEPDQVEHQVDARLQLGAEHGHGRRSRRRRPRPRPAGRGRARGVPRPAASSSVGPARQRGVEQRDVVRARRPSAGRRPPRPRSARAAGCPRRWRRPPAVGASRGCSPLRSTRSSPASAAPPRGSSAPSASSSRAPSACNMPGSAVGARAAADTEHARVWQPRSSAARTTSPVPYELASSAASLSRREQPQPGDVGHLDDRDALAHGERGVDRRAGRAPRRAPRPARSRRPGRRRRSRRRRRPPAPRHRHLGRHQRRCPARPARRPRARSGSP